MHVQLRRDKVPKLLGTVNNKPHATQDDHEDTIPTPPASNSTRSSGSGVKADEDPAEDIYADPVSEEEEPSIRVSTRVTEGCAKAEKPRFKDASYTGPQHHKQSSSFKLPAGGSSQSAGSKRSAASEDSSSESDGPIFSSQTSQKRQKPTANIHAAVIHVPKRSSQQQYGKRNNSSNERAAKSNVFREAQNPPAESHKSAQRATFKPARGADMFEFKGNHDSGPGFRATRELEGIPIPTNSSGSSPLSSALSYDTDDAVLDLLEGKTRAPLVSAKECPICGDEVDDTVREQFQDEFQQGTRLNYKWQQRLCRFHKQHEARRLWRERGYPAVEWDRLAARLRQRRHRDHLSRIIRGETVSHYRERLEQNLRTRNKTAMQTMKANDDRRRSSAGYYGPRGEKLMSVEYHYAQDPHSRLMISTGPTSSWQNSPGRSGSWRSKTDSSRRRACKEGCPDMSKRSWSPNLPSIL